MRRDQIIQWAREAGGSVHFGGVAIMSIADLERFASLFAVRALKLGQPQQPQAGDLVVGVGDGSYDACASHGLAHPCEMCAYEKEVAPLESALAECRDLFPIPEPGQPAEEEWLEAMSCPVSVPAFIRASLAAAGAVEADKRDSKESGNAI